MGAALWQALNFRLSASLEKYGDGLILTNSSTARFEDCASLTVLALQPAHDADDAAALANHKGTSTSISTFPIIRAYNCPSSHNYAFAGVTRIWATDDVIAALTGRFEAYTQFRDVPRALRAAPDATTWAGVQLWLWWLPPSSFARSCGGGGADDRVVCKSRVATIWITTVSAYKASEVLDLVAARL